MFSEIQKTKNKKVYVYKGRHSQTLSLSAASKATCQQQVKQLVSSK
jgi:hypothetical protein